MAPGPDKTKRRKTPWVIGTLMIASLTLLIVLQSTNLWQTFTIDTSSDLLLLYALSSLNFIAFIIFGFIFLRSIIRLARERRTFELGSKLKTRLLIYFFAVSLMPIIAMAVFSYLFLNRALDRWFAQIPRDMVEQAREVQRSAAQDRVNNLASQTRAVASILETAPVDNGVLARLVEAGGYQYATVIGTDGKPIATAVRGLTDQLRTELDRRFLLIGAGTSTETAFADSPDLSIGIARMTGGRQLVLVPDASAETSVRQITDSSVRDLQRLGDSQHMIRRVGLLVLGVLTFLLIFASSWIAFYVARGLTVPVKALAEGAGEIARGNLSHRVDVLAEDELAILVKAFNDMASQLDSSSTELTARRRYIETVLEALPTGVISLDNDGRISTMNGAACAILRVNASQSRPKTLSDLGHGDNLVIIERVVKRAARVGRAADQASLKIENTPNGEERNVALTASALPENAGVVLVIEDLSELISAQRAAAWQEVARRMAHEIKNPLTPIQLSAERIARRFARAGHIDNGGGKRINDEGPLGDVVHESTDTILREVTSLKTMVDEFSQFARLPSVRLESGDVKKIVHQAIAVFAGRYADVDVSFPENGPVPELMVDAEQLKRVFVNLISNAVEAFEPTQEEKRVVISVRHDMPRDLVVLEVADNGKGIAAAELQKLFLPYFTTKGRGTGLGLAIVKRIVSDHNGRINVAVNQPRGARFIIELPVSN